MPSLTNEKLLCLSQAAGLIPSRREGGPINVSTLLRWINKGVTTPTGQTIRLQAVRLGGRWLTSAEALARFVAAQNPDSTEPLPLPGTSTRGAEQ